MPRLACAALVQIILQSLAIGGAERSEPAELTSVPKPRCIMQNANSPITRNTLMIAAAVILAVVLALFVFRGGHNDGQPSAPSGPGNVMEKDQGR